MNLSMVPKLATVLVVGLVSLTLLALSDGPYTTADVQRIISADDGITHNSTVYYDKDTNPFVADVDRVEYGARPAEQLQWWQYGPQWKRDNTLYYSWNGNSWVTEVSVGAGFWRSCGSSANGLCWTSLENDVTLEGGALVRQRLKYYLYQSVAFGQNLYSWTGSWHDHYLE